MGFFSFPHTRTYDSDLGWIIKKITAIDNKLSEYLEQAIINIADPIQWDITTQYPALTMVIDNQGTAYISRQPVPAGIPLDNTSYWSVIFNYDGSLDDLRATIAANERYSTTATEARSIGDLVYLEGRLYKIIADMPAGTAYIVNTNCVEYTVSMRINDLIADILSNSARLTDAEAAIADSSERLTNAEAAIADSSERLTNAEAAIADSSERLTDAESDIANNTAAITEIRSELRNIIYTNVKDYGAIGDGVTDDTDAFTEALSIINQNGGVLYVPQGRYKVSNTLKFNHYGSTLKGETQQGTYIMPTFADKPVVEFGSGTVPALIACRVENIAIAMPEDVTPVSGNVGIFFNYVVNSSIDNCVVGGCLIGVRLAHAGNTYLNNVGVVSSIGSSVGFFIGDNSVSINIENCYAGFSGNAADTAIGLYSGEGNIADVTLNYFDVGNGNYGVLMDGSDSPSETPPTDIRLNNIVVDGSRSACIRLLNVAQRGGIVIDGGWLNPVVTNNNACIQMISVNNVHIRNIHIQQLANSAPMLIGITGSDIADCSVEGCVFSNINTPISLVNAVRLLIGECLIHAYDKQTPTSSAITLVSSSDLIVKGNLISGVYVQGIAVLTNGNYSIITDNVIAGAATPITDVHTVNVIADNITH